MARGRVKRWDVGKGTGQIVDNDDQAEVFFGARNLRGLAPGEIHVGLELDYDRGQNDRGPIARNIRRAGAVLPLRHRRGPRPHVASGTRADRASSASGRRHSHSTAGSPRPSEFAAAPGARPDAAPSGPSGAPPRQVLATLRRSKTAKGGPRRRGETPRGMDPSSANFDCVVTTSCAVSRAHTWSQATSGRLTLHLARASALENAGLCLHPLYGFTYLPGTGLKGPRGPMPRPSGSPPCRSPSRRAAGSGSNRSSAGHQART